ncbi:MAG: alpha/beta hydrolase [Gammaproteobacteria bacterium]|nr:alpha/beta hydrolase [Gammaproteobacteria bacterium]MBU1482053.1 alpha/beta hydrolase [Gammaproteobacteria bacterium]
MSMEDRRQPDAKGIESELIGIVYESAFDPDFWTDLLECVASLFEDRRFNSQKPTTFPDDDLEQVRLFTDQMGKDEALRLATLLPHLYRALKLKREYNDVNHTRGQAQAIIEQFPLGVLLVNSKGKLISANQHALNTIADSNTMFMENDVLCITTAKQDQLLKSLICKAANSPLEDADEHVSFFKIGEEGMELPVSLLITPDPYPRIHFDRQVENCAAIFIASASVKQRIANSALQTIFGLSPAEARLAALLASGVSLNQAADQSCISKNTAKVQLKSVFSKIGVNRQAELVKLILTSPAVFNPADKRKKKVRLTAGVKAKSHINKEAHITLRDGRRLQYAEYGDPQGKPVIHTHGVLGCRYERFPDDLLTRKLGVRLIIPDRPGYGLSEYAPEHGYLDFADDLLELVDHLDIRQCSIMGLSVGAIYASAFAYKTPKRLHNIAMICSTPPFRSFSDFAGMPPSLKLLAAFSKYLPTAARMIADIAITNACKDPGTFLANIPVCASDRVILSHSLLKEHIEVCVLAGSKDCHSGFVQDVLLSAELWPFALKDIQTKTYFWHGTEDTHSPLCRVKPIIDAVPNSRLFRIDGGGHFLIYDHWQEILSTLIH